MDLRRIVILVVIAAAIAVAAAAATPAVTITADLQKAVAAGSAGADHRNGSWDPGAMARSVRDNRTDRPSSDATAPPRGTGRGVGPNKTVPVGPSITAPTVAPAVSPTLPGVRFGQRRYLVGEFRLTPPIGNTTVPGRAIGRTRDRTTAIGNGTAAGLTPPVGRFIRWSPAARWRSGAT